MPIHAPFWVFLGQNWGKTETLCIFIPLGMQLTQKHAFWGITCQNWSSGLTPSCATGHSRSSRWWMHPRRSCGVEVYFLAVCCHAQWRIHRGQGDVSLQLSGRGGQSRSLPPTFMTHNDDIAGFTSQSLRLPAYACKTGSSTAVKLAPRMHQNLPFELKNRERKILGRGISPPRPILWWGGGHPLPTPHTLRRLRRFVHRSSNDSSLTFKPWIRPWSRSCLYSITYLGWRNAVAIPSHCYRQPRSLRCVQEHGASPILRFTHHDHDRPSGGVAQPRTSLSEPTPLQWQFALRCRRQDDQIIYKSLISFSSMFS